MRGGEEGGCGGRRGVWEGVGGRVAWLCKARKLFKLRDHSVARTYFAYSRLSFFCFVNYVVLFLRFVSFRFLSFQRSLSLFPVYFVHLLVSFTCLTGFHVFSFLFMSCLVFSCCVASHRVVSPPVPQENACPLR